MKLQHVWWRDAHDGPHTWTHPDELDQDDYVVQSVGWRLPDTVKPGFLTLAGTVAPGGELANVIHIPHVVVTRVIEWES